MNVEKLAKHLKEFTLDEINMIAEVDCKTELEHLLNTHKLSFEQGVYKYVGESEVNYGVFIKNPSLKSSIRMEDAVTYFMNNYVKKFCKFETYKNYNSIFNFNILPYLKKYFLNDIGNHEIKMFYKACESRGLKPRRVKNTMALLNQLIKYFQGLGVIEKKCSFQVKRITAKNEFSINRIIFEQN